MVGATLPYVSDNLFLAFMYSLSLYWLGVDIPETLEVECTGLLFKQVIRLDRVIFPPGVQPSPRVLKHKDFMIGPIHGGKGGGADDEEATKKSTAS